MGLVVVARGEVGVVVVEGMDGGDWAVDVDIGATPSVSAKL